MTGRGFGLCAALIFAANFGLLVGTGAARAASSATPATCAQEVYRERESCFRDASRQMNECFAKVIVPNLIPSGFVPCMPGAVAFNCFAAGCLQKGFRSCGGCLLGVALTINGCKAALAAMGKDAAFLETTILNGLKSTATVVGTLAAGCMTKGFGLHAVCDYQYRHALAVCKPVRGRALESMCFKSKRCETAGQCLARGGKHCKDQVTGIVQNGSIQNAKAKKVDTGEVVACESFANLKDLADRNSGACKSPGEEPCDSLDPALTALSNCPSGMICANYDCSRSDYRCHWPKRGGENNCCLTDNHCLDGFSCNANKGVCSKNIKALAWD